MLFPFMPIEEISAFQDPLIGFTSASNVIRVVDVPGAWVANGTTFHSTNNELIVVEYLTYVC